MAHTATNSGDDSPYWFVDLETPCTVYALNFFNRHGKWATPSNTNFYSYTKILRHSPDGNR